MRVGHRAHDRESEASPGGPSGFDIASGERLECAAQEIRPEARPTVLHHEAGKPVFPSRRHPHRAAGRGMADGILEEVAKGLFHPIRVDVDRLIGRADLDRYARSGRLALDRADASPDQLGQRRLDACDRDSTAPGPGEQGATGDCVEVVRIERDCLRVVSITTGTMTSPGLRSPVGSVGSRAPKN